jgi:hypothetical protein
MIKKISFLFLFLPFLSAYSQTDISQLRSGFFAIAEDSCSVKKLFESINSESYSSPVLQAYAGATEAASAQCIKGAFKKLEYFSRGKNNIEAAIEQDSENAEIRFLRLATQCNAPTFLEYNNIKEDKALILEQLPQLLQQDSKDGFWLNVANFMLVSEKLSKDEHAVLKELIK